MKHTKYLHIHDWNYWWGYYRCGKDWDTFNGARFLSPKTRLEKNPFFILTSITCLRSIR